jgi:ribosome-binding factor A
MQTGRRQERIAELLKRVVSEALQRELSLEDVGLLSVNEVRVPRDLKTATIFVGVVGSPAQRQKAAAVLQSETWRLQMAVGQAIRLKETPHLQFIIDDSIERGNRVIEILDQLDPGSGPIG